MVFGNDVLSGVIEGNRYIHPRLGIAFTAPEGFRLDQSAQTLLGVGREAFEALRFDAVKLDSSDTLESYLARGLIEDVPNTGIQKLSGLPFPAATAMAQGKDWTFRIGVFEIGGTVYRLILASQRFDAATDERFLAALRSFRQLSSGEAAAIRNERIAIVTASAGDNAATLGGRMSAAGGESAFRVINAIKDGEDVAPGGRYKIVVQ